MFIESIKKVLQKRSIPGQLTEESLLLVNWKVYQLDIASPSDINSRKSLFAAHRPQTRIGVANKENNLPIFNHLAVRMFFVVLNGTRF